MTTVSCAIIGASGYTGAELASILTAHPTFDLQHAWVSNGSQWDGVDMSDAYPALAGKVSITLKQLPADDISTVAGDTELFFLATPHEASLQVAASLLALGKVVIDLSGAFRLSDPSLYPKFYGFEHSQLSLLDDAVYGMAEWHSSDIAATNLVAVPGCYPTASGLGIKPLTSNNLLAENSYPIINAVSGVSGAGKKASLTSSFCEVSLTPYGIFGHRHQPEISEFVGTDVIFTPHLGTFKRGILATIVCQLKEGVSKADVDAVFEQAYANAPMVRICKQAPKLDNVVNQPFCDIFWQVDENTQHVIIVSAIDNLLKGASGQAIQCANLRYGLPITEGLVTLAPQGAAS